MKQVLLEFSSYVPREENSDLQFAPSIHPDTSALCLLPRYASCPQARGSRVRCHFRNMVYVCLFVCLFVCHRDVVKESWFVCLFLKSPRGSFWQKAPPEHAWTRVCFGWELRGSAYEETRGEEESVRPEG